MILMIPSPHPKLPLASSRPTKTKGGLKNNSCLGSKNDLQMTNICKSSWESTVKHRNNLQKKQHGFLGAVENSYIKHKSRASENQKAQVSKVLQNQVVRSAHGTKLAPTSSSSEM